MAAPNVEVEKRPDKIPIAFQLGDRMIDGAVIKPVTFAAFNEYVTEAQSLQQPKTWEGKLRRVRMTKQVAYYTNGTAVPLSQEEILRMPIPAAREIAGKLDLNEGKAGKVVRPGDGIDQAIVYELGSPISGGQGRPQIKELEFLAKTYGEIEDVLAAPTDFQKAAQLIATVAKPLGTSLTALPTWAIAQIMFADGFAIVREVLPHFLGSPAESPDE